MIICPNCMQKELEGAIFCRECGTQLVGDRLGTTETKTAKKRFTASQAEQAQSRKPIGEKPVPGALLTLQFLQDNSSIPIMNEGELILGRIGEGQSVVPDVDLTPYQASDAGVSRLHAELRVSKDQTTIIDLGSSNGTKVNDRRIQPHILHNLQDGDLICLGKLKFKVILSTKKG